jgi:hypothetical protein
MNINGKTVSIVCQGEEESQTLHDVRVEKIGTAEFIVGTIPKGQTTNDWLSGAIGMAPLDKIVDIVVFDSKEDYFKRQKTLNKKKKKEPNEAT